MEGWNNGKRGPGINGPIFQYSNIPFFHIRVAANPKYGLSF
jgi:hypothetical protein